MEELLTSKQVQDLLRVDRITVYRMLGDGRLRGFKVGGQWRFSRREIEAWLQRQQNGMNRPASAPAEGVAPSAQVLSLTCVTAVQSICAEALDVALVTAGLDGVPLAEISNCCAFCHLVLSTGTGRERCAGSWRATPDGQVRLCHAGLGCASVPIAIGGREVALVAVCQFTGAPADGASAGRPPLLGELAAELGLAETVLCDAVRGVHVLDGARLERVSHLLRRVAETLSHIGEERLSLLGRLERIAEMSKL